MRKREAGNGHEGKQGQALDFATYAQGVDHVGKVEEEDGAASMSSYLASLHGGEEEDEEDERAAEGKLGQVSRPPSLNSASY